MDALGFFLECHENVHFRVENELLKLTETQMQTRPHPAVNPVAWVVWHMARCEDMAMNRFVGDRPQVLEEGKWLQRLGLSQRDIGTGMSDQEVDDFSSRVNIPALCDYYQAIGPRTRDIVSQLRVESLDEPIDSARIRRVLYDEGVMGQGAGWIEQSYDDKTKRWFLRGMGLTHNLFHLGEAVTVLGLLGVRGR